MISGESGAGKTEGAKIILAYLGDLCKKALEKDGSAAEEIANVGQINHRLQQASPILESFGNAKTTRNDNSSRFGKFMKIQFNQKGILVGMHNTPYLLEKSRVVKCGEEERLYHSFYQLALGATPDLRQKYLLDEASKYKHLKMGGCLTIPKVDDAKDFMVVLESMKTVGLNEAEIDACWKIVAACLHMQRVEFAKKPSDDHAEIKSGEDCVEKAAKLLEIDPKQLHKLLLTKFRTLQKGKEVIPEPLNVHQASDTRNSLCIFLYERLFLWLVERINDVVSKPQEEAKWIGLLDIFGFENFKVNSFEQLCINLANERLQKHYNTYVYDKDLQECTEEGIKNAQHGVSVNDNQPCLDLIVGGRQSRTSIFSTLDDVCQPKSVDATKDDKKFLDLIVERFGGESGKDKIAKQNSEGQLIVKREKKEDFFEFDPRRPTSFGIHHYAGKVEYNIAGMTSKNKDLLSEDLKKLCRTSENEIISQLIPPPPGDESQKKMTVSKSFVESLNELLETIQSTKPNWVRCIRPNPQKVPDKFHTPSVLDQLTCSGVVETVKTRQQGFWYSCLFFFFFFLI